MPRAFALVSFILIASFVAKAQVKPRNTFQQWIKEQVHFEQPAQEYTLLDYLHEVEHVADGCLLLSDNIIRCQIK
jgi:hypothetical protein